MLAPAMGRVFRVKLTMDGTKKAVLVEANTFAGAIEAAYPHLRLTEDHLQAEALVVKLEVELEPMPV